MAEICRGKIIVIDGDGGWDDLANIAMFAKMDAFWFVLSSYGCTTVARAAGVLLIMANLFLMKAGPQSGILELTNPAWP